MKLSPQPSPDSGTRKEPWLCQAHSLQAAHTARYIRYGRSRQCVAMQDETAQSERREEKLVHFESMVWPCPSLLAGRDDRVDAAIFPPEKAPTAWTKRSFEAALDSVMRMFDECATRVMLHSHVTLVLRSCTGYSMRFGHHGMLTHGPGMRELGAEEEDERRVIDPH